MKTTFVLSGGSTKGCFQAGAMQAALERGFIPQSVYGISVGSLNGAFITNRAGLVAKNSGMALTNADWKTIGLDLRKYWADNIKKPEDVAIKQKGVKLIMEFLFKKFNGLYDTTPIQTLATKTLDLKILQSAPVTLRVGTVDIAGGQKTIYVGPGDANFFGMLIGSIEMPVIMPPSMVNGRAYFDGGLRDIAPLNSAIDGDGEKPDRIICFLCQSEDILPEANFSAQNIGMLAQRIVDVMTNEIVNNDLDWAKFINEQVEKAAATNSGFFSEYKKIDIIVIRPKHQLEIGLDDVTPQKVDEYLNLGYSIAMDTLKNLDPNNVP